jgi:hypothetical protein
VNASPWSFDHCTFVENTGSGYGSNGGSFPTGIYHECAPLADCIFAFNDGCGLQMMWGTLYATNSLFWTNAQGDFGGNGFESADVCDLGDCLYTDPMLCPTAGRMDGAVFAGSPVLGAASDGGNIGCYQGAGVEIVSDAREYFVRPDGDDSNTGLENTSVGAFATVARALDAVSSAGDIVHVTAGDYEGPAALVDAPGTSVLPIRILFEAGATIASANDEPALSFTNCSQVIVEGATVLGGPGIAALNGANLLFTNCVVEAAAGNGLSLSGCNAAKVVDSAFRDCSGNGLALGNSVGVSLLRCVFAGNALAGVRAGINGQNTCPNLRAAYCTFVRNGAVALGMSDTNTSGWFIDHCTFARNDSFGVGPYVDQYGDHGIWPQGPVVTNSLFAANFFGGVFCSHGNVPTYASHFWGNGHFAITDCNNGQNAAASAHESNVLDGADPLLAAIDVRDDGAVYIGSPVIGAAADGSNLGSYQGAGLAWPASATYYVRPDGNDANDGLANTADGAFATLSNACARALVPGDTIRVAAGVYTNPAVLSAVGTEARPVKIVAAPGAVLSAASGTGLRLVDCSEVEIEGLAAAHCAGDGFSIEGSAGVRFANCSASGCTNGVAADATSFRIDFVNGSLVGNIAAGCTVDGSPGVFLDRCRITGNGADGVASANYQPANGWIQELAEGTTLRQCLVAGNAAAGAGAGGAGDIRLESCTVAGNGDGILFGYNRHKKGNAVLNTITAFNGGYGLLVDGDPANENYACGVASACSYGNPSGNFVARPAGTDTNLAIDAASFSADPLFRDASAGDYRITGSSPCVNAGTNIAWMAAATDLNGHNPRIVDDRVDMGAYEIFLQGTLFLLR